MVVFGRCIITASSSVAQHCGTAFTMTALSSHTRLIIVFLADRYQKELEALPIGLQLLRPLICGGLVLYDANEMGLLRPEIIQKSPITLALAGGCFLIYYCRGTLSQYLPVTIEASSIIPRQMVENFGSNWPRLILSALVHLSDAHLYLNMVNLLSLGTQFEMLYGSLQFSALSLGLTLSGSYATVVISYLLTHSPFLSSFISPRYDTPSVGMSGLLFALSTLQHRTPSMLSHPTHTQRTVPLSDVAFEIPNESAVFWDLMLAQMMMSNVSFIGHLGGIAAGQLPPALFCRIPSVTLAILPVALVGQWLFGRAGGSRKSSFSYSSSASASSPSSASSPPNPFQAQMDELYSQGFHDRRLNHAALKETNGDLERAIRIIRRRE